jgi:hypothetical protein
LAQLLTEESSSGVAIAHGRARDEEGVHEIGCQKQERNTTAMRTDRWPGLGKLWGISGQPWPQFPTGGGDLMGGRRPRRPVVWILSIDRCRRPIARAAVEL